MAERAVGSYGVTEEAHDAGPVVSGGCAVRFVEADLQIERGVGGRSPVQSVGGALDDHVAVAAAAHPVEAEARGHGVVGEYAGLVVHADEFGPVAG